jgi:transposase
MGDHLAREATAAVQADGIGHRRSGGGVGTQATPRPERDRTAKTQLGRHRWVVERTFAWIARYRRLTIRYERLVAMHRAFLHLGCALICFNHLQRL